MAARRGFAGVLFNLSLLDVLNSETISNNLCQLYDNRWVGACTVVAVKKPFRGGVLGLNSYGELRV